MIDQELRAAKGMKTAKSTLARRYAIGLFAAAIGITLRLALSPALGTSYPYLFTFPTVAAAAYYAGLAPRSSRRW